LCYRSLEPIYIKELKKVLKAQSIRSLGEWENIKTRSTMKYYLGTAYGNIYGISILLPTSFSIRLSQEPVIPDRNL
jgi:hypothetical protein